MKTVLAVVVGGKNFICQDMQEATRLFELIRETEEAKFSTLDASLPLTIAGKTRPSIEFIDVQEAV